MNARKLIPAAALSVLAATAPAMAHTGVGATHGFVHGFMHPVSGVDHILAMVAVGLFAAHLGGHLGRGLFAQCNLLVGREVDVFHRGTAKLETGRARE